VDKLHYSNVEFYSEQRRPNGTSIAINLIANNTKLNNYVPTCSSLDIMHGDDLVRHICMW
jgi:hypothetical protein